MYVQFVNNLFLQNKPQTNQIPLTINFSMFLPNKLMLANSLPPVDCKCVQYSQLITYKSTCCEHEI